MYNNGAILSCKITKLATQSHRASSHSANYANEPRFSQTCQYSGLWKVLSQLKIGIQGPHLFLLCHKPIIVPLSSGNLKVKHDQRRRQLCSRIKKKQAGKQRDDGDDGVEGSRDRQLTNSQNCSFHWINLLFLKSPQRAEMRANMTQSGPVCMRVCVSFNPALGLL